MVESVSLTHARQSIAISYHFAMALCQQQLHGGAGYMEEYPISRMYRDARVQSIYGGTNEIMKELISRTL